MREAQPRTDEFIAVAALNHLGIVTIYPVEEADEVHFLTIQLSHDELCEHADDQAEHNPPENAEHGTSNANELQRSLEFRTRLRRGRYYGRRRTCPGLILSGSVNWSLFRSKIFM
jgi:hypothetical protein